MMAPTGDGQANQSFSILLSIWPGQKIVQPDGQRTLFIKMDGPPLGEDVLHGARTVGDVAAAVQIFGESVRAKHPDASFFIRVEPRPEQHLPPGFEAALSGNGFGQNNYMQALNGER